MTPCTRAAKEATRTIPIVITQEVDPVGNRLCRQPGETRREHHGIVATFPGAERKTTGAYEGDRTQTLPPGRYWDFEPSGQCKTLKETELAAEAFRVELQYLDVLESQGY